MEDMEEEYIPEGGIRIGDIYIPPPPAPACSFDNNGPRMIITHIENDFFKSYAGKQVLGPFHKSFTSIVGPNGSGKSNVIDSMLFVFGYRAQKIRSKKLSVLIHNSDTHPNVQSCTVSVHFAEIIDKEGDDFEEVPGSRMVVTRTAYKDNSSFYQVDGKRCQFKDVAKVLRAKGIDLDHNRFLILQGEVESISLMKPKGLTEHDTGMLEFLEDIIGTSRFKTPIQLLNTRVGELNEQKVEKLNRVKLVEKEKEELEGPMREAVECLQLENERAQKKNKRIQIRLRTCKKEIEQHQAMKNEIEESVSDLTGRLKDAQNKRKQLEKNMNDKGVELWKLSKEIELKDAEFKKFEVEDTNLKEDLKNTNTRRKKLIQLNKLEKEKLERLEILPEQNREKITECIEQRDKLEKKVVEEEANYEKAMTTLKSETQEFQDEREKYASKLIGLKKACDETQSVLTIEQNKLSIYTSAEQKEKIRLDQLTASIQSTKEQVAEKGSRLKELEVEVPAKEKELSNAQKEAQAVSARYEGVHASLQKVRMEYGEKSSAQAATKSNGRVIDSLMAQKKNGNIPGIIGRLGDLGAIDKKYDVAVSTVGAGSLNVIIVDNTDTGSQCINFLKKHNLGRANFLALNKTAHFQNKCDQRFQAPQGVPRLFDLIKVSDPSVRTAFYHYFRDTLVARDLNQATEIGYGAQRYKVVTLEGKVLELSGTMSGGGNRQMNGLMGQQVAAEPTVDPREMKKMEQSIEQLDAQYREMYNQKQKLEDDIIRFSRELKELKKEMNKLSVEINPLNQQMAMLSGQVAEQKQRVKDTTTDKRKVAELEKEVKAAEAKYDKAAEAAQEVHNEVKTCDAKIKEITGSKIKSVQKKRDDAQNKLDKMKKEITRLEVEIKTSERDLKKCGDKIKGYDDEQKDFEESMLRMRSRKEEIEAICGKVLDDKEELAQTKIKVGEEIRELKHEADAVGKEETELKSSRIEVDQKLELYDTNIRELNNVINMEKRDLRKLALVDVPDEESTELRTFSDDELDRLEVDIEVLSQEIGIIETKLSASRPNMAAINEYKKKEEVYMARAAELEEITKKRDEQRKHHDDLRKQRLTDFMNGFTIITGKLKEMYQMITLGGDAELELVDSLDPFSEGIVFSVRPPKKSWKNITNLSGGEKTLSSLALVFALHYYKPTPLYVMDEIDAALDFKNVSIVANYIKERTRNAQFIIISLRSNMFELADRLVGIYKTYNCTKSVCINPGAVGQVLQPNNKVANISSTQQPNITIASQQPLAEMEVN